VMVGHDGHRGALYYLSVEPARQRQGLGREMVHAAEQWLAERGVWKINLMIRRENAAARGFYERLGFSGNDVISLGKAIRR
jgi:ribosomal protein S18 acetylase RimI-like enzyme